MKLLRRLRLRSTILCVPAWADLPLDFETLRVIAKHKLESEIVEYIYDSFADAFYTSCLARELYVGA
jgi:hypothetical protein